MKLGADDEDQSRSFGERFAGVTRPLLPLDGVTPSFRIAVWNRFHSMCNDTWKQGRKLPPVMEIKLLLTNLAITKNWVVSDLPSASYRQEEYLQNWLLQVARWWEIYELIEEGPRFARLRPSVREGWGNFWNVLLEDEGSPFRFVGTRLAPITTEEEQAAVTQAASNTGPFDVASQHIRNAIALFGKRPQPDYANTVKEALLGVESAVCIATGHRTGDFGGACRSFDVPPHLSSGQV